MNVGSSLTSGENQAEKYSLRPRMGDRRKPKVEPGEEGFVFKGRNNNITNKINGKDNIKQKPASLSKYRRKTANARERSRMREINLAFETLRKAVPSYMPQLVFPGDGSNEKLTKITTLRLAMKYITGLTELLHKDQRVYVTDECNELMECHPIIFRNTDTCTLTALNTSSYDLLNSPNYTNDGGSDGESLYSGATLDNMNFDFSDNFINPELG